MSTSPSAHTNSSNITNNTSIIDDANITNDAEDDSLETLTIKLQNLRESAAQYLEELEEMKVSLESIVSLGAEILTRASAKIAIRSGLLTPGHRSLVWSYQIAGIRGIWRFVYMICQIEISSERADRISMAPRYKPRATSSKRRKIDLDEYVNVGQDDCSSDEVDACSAQDQLGGHVSWHQVIEDYKLGSESRMLFMLSTLPPELISAILYGDLPSRMQAPTVSSSLRSWVQLTDYSGVYAVFVALSSEFDPNQAGRGLTLREMVGVIGLIENYLDIGTEASLEAAVLIDSRHGTIPENLDHSYQRKYGGGDDFNLFDKHGEWLQSLITIYRKPFELLVNTEDEYLADEHMLRCMAYIGMSGTPLSRAPMHWVPNERSSKLWGLFFTAVRCNLEDKYTVMQSSYQIFRTVDANDIGLQEILLTILMGNLWRSGGLSYTWAGGRLRKVSGLKLQASIQFLIDNDHRDENIQDAVMKARETGNLLRDFHKHCDSLTEGEQTLDQAVKSLDGTSNASQRVKEILDLTAMQEAFEAFEVPDD